MVLRPHLAMKKFWRGSTKITRLSRFLVTDEERLKPSDDVKQMNFTYKIIKTYPS